MTQEQAIQTSQETQADELTWNKEDAKTKTTSIKTLTADSCIGMFSISWDNQDSYPTYDLFIDGEFIASSTSLADVKQEAKIYLDDKTHYDNYLNNISKK